MKIRLKKKKKKRNVLSIKKDDTGKIIPSEKSLSMMRFNENNPLLEKEHVFLNSRDG